MKKNVLKPNAQQGKKINALPEKNNTSLFIVIAFILPVLLYIQTVNFKYNNFDDNGIILNNVPFLSHFDNARQAFLTDQFITKSSSLYRPVGTISYMLDVQLSGGSNAWMYNLSNTLILGLISIVLFLILRRFSIPPKLALLGTLIYYMHPLFVSTTAAIQNRAELLLGLFSLLSFLFLMEHLKKGKTIFLLLHWIAFSIALFCKETAAFLPFIFILYFIVFYYEKRFEKKYFINILLYGISGIFWYWLRSLAIGNYSNPGNISVLDAIQSNIHTFPESFTKFFLPFDSAPIPGFTIFKTLAGFVIIILLVLLIIKNKNKFKKEIIFCFLWFLILMLPPMPFKHPLVDYLDHRFFLPFIGILLFLLFIFPKKWLENGDIKRSWLLIALIILSSFTFIKSLPYSDSLTFYNSAILQNSKSPIAYCNRGFIRSGKGDYAGAIEDFDKAIALYDKYSEFYYNRGVAYTSLGNYKNAIDDFNKAVEISPNYAEAYNNRGNVKSNMGDKSSAIEDYNKAISIRPNYARAYLNKGVALGSTGNFKDAIFNFNKAIDLNQTYLEAYENRAIAKYYIKDLEGALVDCENTLRLNPNDDKALRLKSQVQQEIKR